MPPTRSQRQSRRAATTVGEGPVIEPADVTSPGQPRRSSGRRAQLDAATLAIDSEGTQSKRASVEVDLVGVVYQVTPPKSATAMRIAWLAAEKGDNADEVFQALDNWMEKAFGPDQIEDVRARLFDDDDDPLDFPHIMTLMQKLIELNSGLPTTRR